MSPSIIPSRSATQAFARILQQESSQTQSTWGRGASIPSTSRTYNPAQTTNSQYISKIVDVLFCFQKLLYIPLKVLYNYRTLVAGELKEGQKLVIVSGGDAGNSEAALAMWHQLPNLKPDIIFMGGDIPYDNNIIDCYWTWDVLMKELEAVSRECGRLVPIVMTLGNHDIGFNAGADQQIQQLPNIAQPIYFSYFPQIDTQIRRSYFHKVIGNVVYFVLDSEFVTPMEEQVAYVDDVLSQLPNTIRFAQYHDPIYWGCNGRRADQVVNDKGVKYWVPLFDKWRFMTTFENHAHMQKRTQPMRNSQPHPNGTIYLGDGSWGADLVHCKDHPDYVVNEQTKHHVWITTITRSGVSHRAIDEYGIESDYVEQLVGNYVDQ